MSASCYILEISVVPGGVRRGDVLVYNQPEHILACLDQELLSSSTEQRGFAGYLVIWYTERFLIWIVQQGRVVKLVDVHDYVEASVDDEPWFLLNDEAARERAAKAFDDVSCDWTKVAMRFRIDQKALRAALPPLEGKVLSRGESMEMTWSPELESYANEVGSVLNYEVDYGYGDYENDGEKPMMISFVDPDPD